MTSSAMPEADPAHVSATGERRQSMARAGIVGAATLASRLLGLVRESIFARLFGTGLYADAFVIAFRIPNLLRDLLAEGALSAALVPALVDAKEKRGPRGAFDLASVMLTALFVVVGLLTIAAAVFAPAIVDSIAGGFRDTPEKRTLAISLTRWILPFLLLVSWAAVFRSILNAFHHYTVPSLGPALLNAVVIAAGLGFLLAGLAPDRAIYGWALAMLAGAAAILIAQAVPLWRLGFRPRLLATPRQEGFARVLRQMVPAVVGLSAVQINILVNSSLASLVPGDVSVLNYAFRVYFLPLGVVGVAVATVSTVSMSGHVSRADGAGFARALVDALRLVAFLTLPAALGFAVLADPIVRLIYEHGDAFGAADTARTATALRLYAIGLVFYAAVKVVAPALYVIERHRWPLVASLAAVAANLVCALGLHDVLGFRALALGLALGGVVNLAVLWLPLRGRFTDVDVRRQFAAPLLGMLALAAASVGVAWGLNLALEAALGDRGIAAQLAGVFIPVAAAAAVLFAGGSWMGLSEARDVRAAFARRFWGRPPSP